MKKISSIILCLLGCFYLPVFTYAQSTCATYSLPFREGFESGTIPNCWTQSGSPVWLFIKGNAGGSPSAANSGNFNACLKDNTTASNKNMLVTPSLNLSGVSNPELKFWHTQQWYNYSFQFLWWSINYTYKDILKIYYRTSASGEWIPLNTYTNNISLWQQESINLPNPTGDYYLAFEGDAMYGQGVCIDDVEVLNINYTAPSIQASEFTIQDINLNSMNISWVRGSGTEVVVLVHQGSPVNADPLNGVNYANPVFGKGEQIGTGNYVVYKGNSNNVTITGLLASTEYYFAVYEYSAGYYKTPALTGNGTTTSCPEFKLPFIETFENNSYCWQQEAGPTQWQITSVWHNLEFGNKFACLKDNTSTSDKNKLISPPLDLLRATNPVLSFEYTQKALSGNQDKLTIYYKATDDGSWIPIKTYSSERPVWGSRETIPLPAPSSKYYIAFEGDAVGGYGIYINDIAVVDNGSWTGNFSDDWNNELNWEKNIIPDASKNISIPSGCAHYPKVDKEAFCYNLNVLNGGEIFVTNGADLNVNGNLSISSSGTFEIDGGKCNVIGDFKTDYNSSINISNGIFNFKNWLHARGIIDLSGGVINASGSIGFYPYGVIGKMSGPFILNIGDDFSIYSSELNDPSGYVSNWGPVNNGTINLLGTGTAPFSFNTLDTFLYCPGKISSVVYNLTINAPGKTYIFGYPSVKAISNLILDVNIKGNLTITEGSAVNGEISNIELNGNWINNGGTFIPGSDTVFLVGENQTITGKNTFSNLIKIATTASHLAFGTGEQNRTTITGKLDLQGSEEQILTISSITDGEQWEIDPQGIYNLNFLGVKDSKNTNPTTLNGCGLIDLGNNENWDFAECTFTTKSALMVDEKTSSLNRNSIEEKSFLKIYPVPVTDALIIESNATIERIEIIGIAGNIVKILSTVNSTNLSVDMKGYEAGNYIISIIFKDKAKASIFKKIVKL